MAPSTTDTRDDSRARVRRVAGAVRALFATRPAGLLTDVDGTISRITVSTTDARVTGEARAALSRLAGQLDLVAVITGRTVEHAQQMVGAQGVTYVGNHGLEWLHDGAVVADPGAVAARPHLEAALSAVRAAIPDRGLQIEDKRISLAIHYRRTERPDLVEPALLGVLRPLAEAGSLRLIEGRLVVNVLPAVPVDKGAATRRLVEEHGLRSAAFFGDDVTDLHAFRVLRALRDTGVAQTLIIGVGSDEAPPEVRSEADLVLEGVGEVERVLTALARRPPRRGSADS